MDNSTILLGCKSATHVISYAKIVTGLKIIAAQIVVHHTSLSKLNRDALLLKDARLDTLKMLISNVNPVMCFV